jgi:transcriptional regulator with XRE-family HTH domain
MIQADMHRSPNFSALLAGLESAGLSTGEIARQSGLHRTTIWRLRQGEIRRPSWDAGDRILSLAKKTAPNAARVQPTVR